MRGLLLDSTKYGYNNSCTYVLRMCVYVLLGRFETRQKETTTLQSCHLPVFFLDFFLYSRFSVWKTKITKRDQVVATRWVRHKIRLKKLVRK